MARLQRRMRPNRAKLKSNLSAWLIMLPSLILFAFFIWEPLLATARMSFFSIKGTKIGEFVGLKNYLAVINHPIFMTTLRNTFVYLFWSLLIGFFLPIVMAALITETVHCRGLFRVGVYFPNIVPGIAAMLILVYFFDAGGTGVLNILLSKIGIGPLPWLNDSNWTIPLIVISMTWKAAGSTALVYLASISGINPDLYEAATMDGATPFKRFWHITLPSLFSLGKSLLILQIISVFQVLYEPMMMTNGGPNNASVSLLQQVYRFAFDNYQYANATALSVMVCLMLLVLTALYFVITRNTDGEGG